MLKLLQKALKRKANFEESKKLKERLQAHRKELAERSQEDKLHASWKELMGHWRLDRILPLLLRDRCMELHLAGYLNVHKNKIKKKNKKELHWCDEGILELVCIRSSWDPCQVEIFRRFNVSRWRTDCDVGTNKMKCLIFALLGAVDDSRPAT